MAERPFFSYTWISEITHDSLNSAGYADEPFRKTLEKLQYSGVLNHTVLVFLSDHGLRFGDVRATYIVKFEDRHQFAFLPQTHFDMHATLVELLDYPDLKRPSTTYALSLLHEVPDTRTCADASISHQWCTCNVRDDATVSNTLAASLAGHFVAAMNDWVAKTARKCAEYQLLQVMDVTALQATPSERAANTSHYWITVKLSPGEAVFEGTVRVRGDNSTVLEEFSRCNSYSRLAYRVRNEWQRLFCYCRRSAVALI
ncbi:uncharacterized protein LOC144119561 [Amblyomma americanum]